MKKNFLELLLLTFSLHLFCGARPGPIRDEAARRWLEESILSVELGRTVEMVPRAGESGTAGGDVPGTNEDAEETKECAAPEAADEPISPATAVPRTISFSRETFTNRTSLSPDVDRLRREPLPQSLPADSPQILILHTHATEAYTPTEGWEYTESDTYRTTDCGANVVRVGDELAAELTRMGLRVIHDRELYDYPDYSVSYARSAAAVEQWLALYPGIGVVIDLHRDALGEGDIVYKTRAETEEGDAAQVMLLVGTGENGLPHPRWQDNFALSLKMQDAMFGRCPALPRPIELVAERYNQHYTTGSLILEVGSCGNTMPEALRAIRAFARSTAPVLLSLVEG